MGVPKFYRWISERYPCLSETVKDHQIPEFDNLYLDMNGIVHVCSHPDDNNPHFRITEERIFADIFHYLEVLFRMIKPRKVFFMAIDGVAPRAKMNQQRGRRLRSAKDAENLEQQARARGETLPTEARFDSNCITPGTEFMVRLHEQLQYFVVNKVSTDKLWQGVTVYLSGHETPGEGEHKIMDFIRTEKVRPDYDHNTRHCLYGLDADLIMLGLTTHEPHFALLREEVRFGKQAQRRSNTVEETTFHLLHISLLREYLDLEFACIQQNLISFSYNLERVIDDWVLMGFLVGNDFIPHLPHLHIAQDALPTIWSTYKQMLPSLGGYLSDKGKLNLYRMERFLNALSDFDRERFSEGYADMKWMDNKSAGSKRFGARKKMGALPSLEMSSLEPAVDELDSFADEEVMATMNDEDLPKAYVPVRVEDEDSLSYEFRKHKACYYFEKMELQATPEVLAQQAKDYVLGLQWILYYYYTGVRSWGWFYTQHYSPYLSDLHSFSDMEIELDPGQPFLPFQQLMAVLPSASMKLLPDSYRTLMLDERSPIVDFYPKEFDFDLNGKQQDWEAVVLIPFIVEQRLIAAMTSVEHGLTEAEKARNGHGPCIVYSYCQESQGRYKSSVPDFPDVTHNRTTVRKMTWKDFVVPFHELRAGLSTNVKPALYYPGFPTFTHIPIKSYLQKMGVTIFQQASRNENRIVQILDDMEIDDIDLEELGKKYLGKSIWVNWPHMFEARVCALETYEEKVELAGKDKTEVVKAANDENSQNIFVSLSDSISDRDMKRRGLDIGPTFLLVHAQPIAGRKYVYLKDGRVTVDKEWQLTPVAYTMQACVDNGKILQLGVESSGSVQFFSLEDVFPMGSHVYVLAHPYYGCEAEVLDHPEERVRVKVNQLGEPDLSIAMEYNKSARYMKAYELAQHLGVSSHFVSRITGTMFLSKGNENLNIGLDLKNNKKNEECPGYTRKEGNDWLYSKATEQVIYTYLQRFPDFCNYLHENLNKDKTLAESVFPEDREGKCQELMGFVKSLPTYKCPRAKCGGEFLEEPTVRRIEKSVSNNQSKTAKRQTMIVKPSLIYKEYSLTSTMIPDPGAEYRLFDRVVNVRMGYTVPFGLRGTVIGIINAPDPRDTQIEIVFDKEFACGLTTRCSPGRGYRCPTHALINVSHGVRVATMAGLNKTKKSDNMAQARRNSPRPTQTSSYSSALSSGSAVNSADSANSSNNCSKADGPQLTVLKRPSPSKEKLANEGGSSRKVPKQNKAVALQSDTAKSSQVPSTKAKGSAVTVKTVKSATSSKPANQRDKAKTAGDKFVNNGLPQKATSSPIGLMTPSEFVTPRTQTLDGRRKASEPSEHVDIWMKLKVANAADKAQEKTISSNTNASAPAIGQQDGMSQALAALQQLNIAPAPPTARVSPSTRPMVTIEKLLSQPVPVAESPKAGEKIDLTSLLQSGERPRSTSPSSSGSQSKSKPVKRELYVAGKVRPTSAAAAVTSSEDATNPALTRVQAQAGVAPPVDGFNFESLVSALEKSMSESATRDQLQQLSLPLQAAAAVQLDTQHGSNKDLPSQQRMTQSVPQQIQSQDAQQLPQQTQPLPQQTQQLPQQTQQLPQQMHQMPQQMQQLPQQIHQLPQQIRQIPQQMQQLPQQIRQIPQQMQQLPQQVQQLPQQVQRLPQQMQQLPQPIQRLPQHIPQQIHQVPQQVQQLPQQMPQQMPQQQQQRQQPAQAHQIPAVQNTGYQDTATGQPQQVNPQEEPPSVLQVLQTLRALDGQKSLPPDVLLERWSVALGIQRPQYQIMPLQSPEGPVWQATVHIGGWQFTGLVLTSQMVAARSAAQVALVKIGEAQTKKGQEMIDQQRAEKQRASLALHGYQVHSPQMPVSAAAAEASTSKPYSDCSSPFVPLQVTKKQAHHDNRWAPEPEPPVAQAAPLPSVEEPVKREPQPTRGSAGRANKPHKPKPSKSRLAANFRNPSET